MHQCILMYTSLLQVFLASKCETPFFTRNSWHTKSQQHIPHSLIDAMLSFHLLEGCICLYLSLPQVLLPLRMVLTINKPSVLVASSTFTSV